MKITKFEYQKKDPNRVNVFVDDEYLFSMYVNDLLEFSILVGQEIETEKIDEIIKKDVFTRMYDRALSLVTGALKTEKQVQDYVWKTFNARKKDWIGDSNVTVDIDALTNFVLGKLRELDLVNDMRFAEAYISAYYLIKPVSIYELTGKLMTKGINKDIAYQAVQEAGCDEEEMLRFALQKKYKSDLIKKEDQKVIQYLSRKGFSWDLISAFVEE